MPGNCLLVKSKYIEMAELSKHLLIWTSEPGDMSSIVYIRIKHHSLKMLLKTLFSSYALVYSKFSFSNFLIGLELFIKQT